MKSRILIVDDHPIFRMGMAELLNQEDDFEVCAVAEDIVSARKAIIEFDPDLAIIDITLAGDNGLDLVKEISAGDKCIHILVLSMHDESVWAERAIRAGAKGYIMKREASESVISALRNIVDGKIHVSANMLAVMLDKFHVKPDSPGAPTIDLLTDRELEVFRLIGAGLATREVADRMNLGVKTVGTYRDRIKQKLCIKTSAELSRRAVLWTERERL
ncbi:MAG: DNA-binding response regulator [Desulfobulbaceae bacterium S3730MH12]|nr:MAG: DNA-binding response regulator [Desulfobulbaceae bacterium S5133MH15]OEU57901.1 MAG: DNA-binding response regulator [Desulfobulbaceae bacterium S3730MH12]OEU84264.1 MAG: DNA-binding response regulator [Desulfobulbaceae bacterium C00003063]